MPRYDTIKTNGNTINAVSRAVDARAQAWAGMCGTDADANPQVTIEVVTTEHPFTCEVVFRVHGERVAVVTNAGE